MLRMLALVVLAGLSGTALAEAKSDQPKMGTPEQRNACGPDVGHFCRKIKPEDGPMAYLACLQENRPKLSSACRKMLEGVGQ